MTDLGGEDWRQRAWSSVTTTAWDVTRYRRTNSEGYPYHAHNTDTGWYVNYDYREMPELYGPRWRVSRSVDPRCPRRLRGKRHIWRDYTDAEHCDCQRECFSSFNCLWDHTAAWSVGGNPVTTAEPNCTDPEHCSYTGCMLSLEEVDTYANKYGLYLAVMPKAGRRSCRSDALVILSSVPVDELGLIS